MYNTYTTSSALWSLGIKRSSPSYSLNDYSNLLNEKFDRIPFASSSSSRCCCALSRSFCSYCSSSFATQRVPISARFFLYGLRQSTLIQWSPVRRRLVLSGGDRFFNRFLDDGLDGDRCETSFCIRKRYCSSRNIGRRRKERFRFKVLEESGERFHLGGLDEAEAVITLLSEECLCCREKKWIHRAEGKTKAKCDTECYKDNRRRVEIERSNNESETLTGNRDRLERQAGFDSEQCRGNKRIEEVRRGEDYESERYGRIGKVSGLESDSVCGYKSVTVRTSRERSRRNEDREGRARRTKSSSRLSYYSLSSSGELESDIEEDQNKDIRFDCDSRKKSEKRLIEVLGEESQTGKESSEILSGRKTYEVDYHVASGYQKQYHDEEEKSDLAVNLDRGKRKQYSLTGNNVSESKRNYEDDTEIRKIHVNNVQMNSQSEKHFTGRKENMVVTVGSDVDRENIGERSTELNKRSKIRYTGDERISQTQRQSRYGINPEEYTNLTRKSVQEIKEQFSEKSEIRDTNIRNTSVSQSESHRRNQDEYSSLISGSQSESKEQYYRTDQIPLQINHSSKGSVSVSHTSDVIRITKSGRAPEKRIIDQESILTSFVQPGRETKQFCDQTDATLLRSNSRKELEKPFNKDAEEGTTSQSSFISASQNKILQVNLDKEDLSRSSAILMPPPSQLVNRGPRHQTGGSVDQEAISYETSERGYDDALYTHQERIASASGSESHGEEIGDVASGEPSILATQEGALDSAHRSEHQSAQLIGEFVEKSRHDVSISEAQKEGRTETFRLRRLASKRSSQGSGAKGPSDEMWVTNPSAQENTEVGQAETSAESRNAIAKKSGRSMWSVVGDVFRLRWGLHAGTSDSAAKSAGKSSPNESVSSERWFSGLEHDGSSDDNTKSERRIVPREAASSHQLEVGHTSSQCPHEVELSASSSRLEGGSASRRMSSVSGDQNLGLNEDRRSSHGPPVPITDFLLRPPLVPAQGLRRSPVVKEPSESSHTEVSGSSSLNEQVEQKPQSSLSHEKGVTPLNDSLLKQRKLRRNKQVIRDRFDEWEEAYRREAEQRKADEMFMREALLEAKKAADVWEVPVGAVLVHDGKIIARGYNLVEGLRDSTAHAEIICIREGSIILRSWRLADTTLYVTLEPCPMCAGAILQARVNTLVYGAPNKLLGADGSWIRLFPGGEGNGSEPSDKLPAPIHPFHPKMTIRRGILESECAEVMQQFFQLRRKKKDENHPEPPPPSSSRPVSHHHPSRILNKMHHIFQFMFCL